jgi:hypothetical protein
MKIEPKSLWRRKDPVFHNAAEPYQIDYVQYGGVHYHILGDDKQFSMLVELFLELCEPDIDSELIEHGGIG